MKNAYIDLMQVGEEIILPEKKYHKIIKWIIKRRRKVKIEELENKDIVIKINVSSDKFKDLKPKKLYKILDNVIKIAKKYNVDNIILSQILETNNIIEYFKNNSMLVIDGKVAYVSMLTKMLDKIALCLDSKLEKLEVAILSKQNEDTVNRIIYYLSNHVKVLTIITTNIGLFKRTSEKIFEESGMVIKVTNSTKNSLKNSDVIINIDCNNTELNNCNIPNSAIIINLGEDIKVAKRTFEGIVIKSVVLTFAQDCIDVLEGKINPNRFSSICLYESMANKNSEELKLFEINRFVGNSGDIDKNEFKRIKGLKEKVRENRGKKRKKKS